jgi:hypothetical protein
VQGLMQVPDFPIKPDDNLEFAGVERMEELEDVLVDLTDALGVRMLTLDEYHLITREAGGLRTVENLVILLAIHCDSVALEVLS